MQYKLLAFFLFVRSNFWFQLFTINLRFLIGFGFIPSGVKKIIGHHFANPGQKGAFFEYLDALYATGFYYEFIGWAQVLAAILLITQRYATIGALMFLPIILNITILTFSTIPGSLTPIIACLMLFGILYLLLWDFYKWGNIFSYGHIKTFEFAKNLPKQHFYWTKVGLLTLVIPAIFVSILSVFQITEESTQKNLTGFTIVFFLPLIPIIANLWFIIKRKSFHNN